jgi:hypothetical protein
VHKTTNQQLPRQQQYMQQQPKLPLKLEANTPMASLHTDCLPINKETLA